MTRRYTAAEIGWVRENYPRLGMSAAAEGFAAEFGYARTRQALGVLAHKLGIHVTRNDPANRTGANRKIYWSREPEMTAWMIEHDRGRVQSTIDAFEREFGVRMVRTQVSQFRSTHGTTTKRGYGGRPRHPVGHERPDSKGNVLVKVAEEPTVPCTKDNWRMKHLVVWERANGRPVPEGHEVVFADRDRSNFDPSNLVACPRRVVGIINACGYAYRDADSLHAAMALAELSHGIRDAEMRPRRCEVCGSEFVPPNRQNPDQRVCPSCTSKGRKSKPRYKGVGEATCAICGKRFVKVKKHQRRCPSCISEHPKLGVDAHLSRINAQEARTA